MRYGSVTVTRRGGPEVLEVIERDLRPPSAGEVRARVLAAPVSLPDVEARYGRTPFPLKYPFVPGYAVVGTVDAVGAGVAHAAVGDGVAALTVHGGYADVAARFPILEAARANELLEGGQVVGNIVLLAPELL